MKLKIGDIAPDFDLADQFNEVHKLSSYLGRTIILYFYPKDDTPGCTKEACSFRDSYGDFRKRDAVILGVNADSTKSHSKFQEKYNLPFTILSDTDHQVCESYGVWALKKYMGREYFGIVRTTFIIGADGRIKEIFEKVKPENHANEILAIL